ncbi:MAG: NAD(P)H-flavin reductase [Thiotrichales bacterium]|nr:NAD(P)H-flavin reductase [Thiotrichales bacterium]
MLQKMTVVDTVLLTPDIIQLLLSPLQPFSYQAGDYVLLGLDEVDLKPFSIASAPRLDGLVELHIRNHDDSDWMLALFDVKRYDTVFVQGPKAQYQLELPMDKPVVFVAGGTGFAPMKALLDVALQQPLEQIIEFYWGVRTQADLYWHVEMLGLCKNYPNLNYIPVISDEDFSGRTGLVHKAVLQDHPSLVGFRVYLCGPWEMQTTAKAAFLAAGLPVEQFN